MHFYFKYTAPELERIEQKQNTELHIVQTQAKIEI